MTCSGTYRSESRHAKTRAPGPSSFISLPSGCHLLHYTHSPHRSLHRVSDCERGKSTVTEIVPDHIAQTTIANTSWTALLDTFQLRLRLPGAACDKMPMKDFIHARIFLDGKPALEYADPDDPDTDTTATRYIEVSAGQFWMAELRVVHNFSLRNAPGLRARFEFDDHRESYGNYLSTSGLQHDRGYLTEERTVSLYDGICAWNDQTGGWMRYNNQIGPLGIGTYLHLCPRLGS